MAIRHVLRGSRRRCCAPPGTRTLNPQIKSPVSMVYRVRSSAPTCGSVGAQVHRVHPVRPSTPEISGRISGRTRVPRSGAPNSAWPSGRARQDDPVDAPHHVHPGCVIHVPGAPRTAVLACEDPVKPALPMFSQCPHKQDDHPTVSDSKRAQSAGTRERIRRRPCVNRGRLRAAPYRPPSPGRSTEPLLRDTASSRALAEHRRPLEIPPAGPGRRLPRGTTDAGWKSSGLRMDDSSEFLSALARRHRPRWSRASGTKRTARRLLSELHGSRCRLG